MHAMRALPFFGAASLFAATTLTPIDARADAKADAKGLAVVAQGDAAPFASSLARALYADPALLPPTLDEARARALSGGAVGSDAPREIQDLAATRAALRGDDAPSRNMLASITASLHLKGVVVVEGSPGERPTARVFVASSGAFDAVSYEPDPAPPVTWGSASAAWTWSGAVSALRRGFVEAPVAALVVAPAPLEALAPTQVAPSEKTTSSKPFYTSPWFWGAIGAAAFAGAAFYFATRDSADPNIQLQVQVPR